MTNIATLLKGEISRVARKEVRAEIQALKKASAAYRAEIAALKRRASALEQEVRRMGKIRAKPAPSSVPEANLPLTSVRFSPKSLASQRRRLGLSAADCGLLVGASGLSIYKWESGQARPRVKFVAPIARLRSMGKKEAAAQLESLRKAQ